jgi:hypothetical protein
MYNIHTPQDPCQIEKKDSLPNAPTEKDRKSASTHA